MSDSMEVDSDAERTLELSDNLRVVLDNLKRDRFRLNLNSTTYQGIGNFLFFGGRGADILNADIDECYDLISIKTVPDRKLEYVSLLILLPVLYLDFGLLGPNNQGNNGSGTILDKVNFLVDTEESSYSDWDFPRLLEKMKKEVNNREVEVTKLSKIHRRDYTQVSPDSNEARVGRHVCEYLSYVIKSIKPIKGGDFSDQKRIATSSIADGMFVFDNGRKEIDFAPVEIKRPFVHNLLRPDTENITKEMTVSQWKPLIQDAYYLLKSNLPGFMLVDGYHFIFCEIDWKKFKRLQALYEAHKAEGNVAKLPFKFKYRNLLSINPSLTLCVREQLTEWYEVVKNETTEEKEERQSVFQEILAYISILGKKDVRAPESTSTSQVVESSSIPEENNLEALKPTLVLNWSDVIDVFHYPRSVVVQVKARVLMEGIYWEDRKQLKGDDLVMLKLPWVVVWKYNGDMFAERELNNEDADSENENIHTLFKIKGFNNCFLRHNYREVEIHHPDQVVKGHFVASRYIKSILTGDYEIGEVSEEEIQMEIDQQDEEVKMKIYQQEQLLVDNGLYHNGMAMRNVLYDGQDVYLIDFSYAGSRSLYQYEHFKRP